MLCYSNKATGWTTIRLSIPGRGRGFVFKSSRLVPTKTPLFVRSLDVNSVSFSSFSFAHHVLSISLSQLTAYVIIKLSLVRYYGQRVVIKETDGIIDRFFQKYRTIQGCECHYVITHGVLFMVFISMTYHGKSRRLQGFCAASCRVRGRIKRDTLC